MKPPQTIKIACLLCALLYLTLTAGAQPVIEIAAGTQHSLFLKSDGSLMGNGLERRRQWHVCQRRRPIMRRHLQQHKPS